MIALLAFVLAIGTPKMAVAPVKHVPQGIIAVCKAARSKTRTITVQDCQWIQGIHICLENTWPALEITDCVNSVDSRHNER